MSAGVCAVCPQMAIELRLRPPDFSVLLPNNLSSQSTDSVQYKMVIADMKVGGRLTGPQRKGLAVRNSHK